MVRTYISKIFISTLIKELSFENLLVCMFAVFHVKDEHGNKLTDKTVINHIKHVCLKT